MMNDKLIGIWIDLREAILATGEEIVDIIESEFDVGNAKGGSGSDTPWGPQDVISESKVLEKRKQSLAQYFRYILNRLEPFDQVLIMGPGLTKNHLKDAIESNHKTRSMKITVETIDKMTLNQIRARIRAFKESIS